MIYVSHLKIGRGAIPPTVYISRERGQFMKEEEKQEFLDSDIYWAIPRKIIGSNRTGPPTQEEKYAWLEYRYEDAKYKLDRYWELYGDLPPEDYKEEERIDTFGKVAISVTVGLFILAYIYFKLFS